MWLSDRKIDKTYKPDGKPADYTIDTAYVTKNDLCINTSYSGGCCINNFELVWNGNFFKSLPMKAPLALIHTASKNSCKGIQKYTLHFDVSALKQPAGKLILLIEGYTKSPLYLDM